MRHPATAIVTLTLALGGCSNQAKKESVEHINLGATALTQKQYDTAATEYKEAIRLLRDNHAAWYGLGAAYVGRNNYKDAADAFGEAVKLEPGEAMYQMWLGISLYKAAIAQAREEQAKNAGKKPEEIVVNLKGVNFDPALQHLQSAVKINGALWRAHDCLGRVFREQDKPEQAAESFTRAIQNNPRESGPYQALAGLYRRWDYTEQAIQVASQGTANIPGQNERSEVFFELGMAQLDNRNVDEAIKAFSGAVEDKRDNHKAKFQRGQAFFEKGELAKAQKDLEDYEKVAGPNEITDKNLASKLIQDIKAKQR